ncbi:MAG TPA: helix-turn-helix transcriptional regulator [Bacillales bacterium]|nr:helix-turn-helix transcriptional regulator [Bacillales bacterium]
MENILGARIKYLRERNHLSQKEMADRLAISNVQLSRYETGTRKPDPETIARIAGFFHVSADFLLGLASSVHDPKSVYITEQEHALLEQIKQHPDLEEVFRDLLNSSEQSIKTFIKMWALFKQNKD